MLRQHHQVEIHYQSAPNTPSKSLNNKTGGFTFVPKNGYNAMLKKNPELQQEFPNMKPISRRDRDSKKWTQAIMERHEADELRYSKANAKKGIQDKADARISKCRNDAQKHKK